MTDYLDENLFEDWIIINIIIYIIIIIIVLLQEN